MFLSGQLITNSLILANRLTSTVGHLDAERSGPRLTEIFYRHFAWLTALRFFLRDRKSWENALEPGNVDFLAKLPTPESQSTLKDELKTYLSDAELQKVLSHRGDKEALILHWQYEALSDLYNKKLISEFILIMLTGALHKNRATAGPAGAAPIDDPAAIAQNRHEFDTRPVAHKDTSGCSGGVP